MTHRLFVTTEQISNGEVAFGDDQAHQLRNVLRLRRGSQVRVFDGAIRRDLVVELVDATHGRIVGDHPQADEPKTRLMMYPALLQRDKFEAVLQKLTEIGVAAITPVITVRALVREVPDERRCARWRVILREAAEQSGRGVVPQLMAALSFDKAVASAEGTVLVAYEREQQYGLRDALAARPTTVSLFVGPEGGYAPEEAECAQRAGAQLISLGPRILRSETASPVLAALVLYELDLRA